MPTIARLTMTFVAFALASAASAQDRPATFAHAERALESLIEFPTLRGDTAVRLRCASIVEKNGKFDNPGCYQVQPADQVFIAPIVKAAQKARMTPAVIGGKPVSVYVQFQVEMVQKGEEKSIRILNNPGLEEMNQAYGEEHVAAQRTITDEAWQKVCPQRTRFLVWAKAHVAADGRQRSISVTPAEGHTLTQTCHDAIVATLEKSRFTPAYADGEPVPSSFIEPFGS